MKMVCIKKGAWKCLDGGPAGPCPNYGEIVTVCGTHMLLGELHYDLEEYNTPEEPSGLPPAFLAIHFRPIVKDELKADEAFDYRKLLNTVDA